MISVLSQPHSVFVDSKLNPVAAFDIFELVEDYAETVLASNPALIKIKTYSQLPCAVQTLYLVYAITHAL